MKQFLKFTLASTIGVLIATAIIFILGLIILTGVIASGVSSTPTLTDNSVLKIDISGQIDENVNGNVVQEFLGQGETAQGAGTIVNAIDRAAEMDEIKVIYLKADIVSAGWSTLEGIRNALQRAQGKGKMVVAYGKTYSQRAYYLCSVADEVWIHPQGMVEFGGLAAKSTYWKDLLAKFDVKMTVVKVGKYKSFTEQYTEDRMSDANREQVGRYVHGLWNEVTSAISASRKVSQAALNALADSVLTFRGTDVLLRNKLVDKTLYQEDVKGELKKLLGIDNEKKITQVSCKELMSLPGEDVSGGKKIAVYYCEGTIVRNVEAGLFSEDGSIVSTTLISDFERIAKDDDIAAVVLRINSGGGDAFASEEIWHAVQELKKKKPVVVSMAGSAASGAYYMSVAANTIVAQPTTLTGSIGVFGVFPDVSGLMSNILGVRYDGINTNKHSDINYALQARPLNAEEVDMLQHYVEDTYSLFLQRVAEGRKMSVDSVNAIAQGRVWLAKDALEKGLIDKMGGMDIALKEAATLAKVDKYDVVTYPEQRGWMELLTDAATSNKGTLDEQLHETWGALYEPVLLIRTLEKQSPVQALSPIVVIE